MTETLATIMDPTTGLKVGYTGQLLPTVQVKVVDVSTGEALPANTDGEICMKCSCVGCWE